PKPRLHLSSRRDSLVRALPKGLGLECAQFRAPRLSFRGLDTVVGGTDATLPPKVSAVTPMACMKFSRAVVGHRVPTVTAGWVAQATPRMAVRLSDLMCESVRLPTYMRGVPDTSDETSDRRVVTSMNGEGNNDAELLRRWIDRLAEFISALDDIEGDDP